MTGIGQSFNTESLTFCLNEAPERSAIDLRKGGTDWLPKVTVSVLRPSDGAVPDGDTGLCATAFAARAVSAKLKTRHLTSM